MSDQNVDLTLIARQQRKMIEDFAIMCDDMAVMMAILQRLDGTVSGLVNEVRAVHSKQARMSSRLRDLEGE